MANMDLTKWRVESDNVVLSTGSETDTYQAFDAYRRQSRLVGTIRMLSPSGLIIRTALDLTGCHPTGQSRFDLT